jgi:hypothetical protein
MGKRRVLKPLRWPGVALGVSALVGGCTSDLDLALEGKRCSADGRCVAGYECDRIINRCVRSGSVDGKLDPIEVDAANDGAGGQADGRSLDDWSGVAGTDGSGGGSAGAVGSSAAAAGSSGAGAVAGTPNDRDAGRAALPDSGCISTTAYYDADGDGFGHDEQHTMACPSLQWVAVSGDCRDDLPLVNPGQQDYFGVGYLSSSSPGGISFDYDCVNGEQPDPENDTNDLPPAPADCATLLGPDCTGGGFEPVEPLREGAGIEPRCGSIVRTRCVLGTLLGNCNAVEEPVDGSVAFRCK